MLLYYVLSLIAFLYIPNDTHILTEILTNNHVFMCSLHKVHKVKECT